MDRFFNMDNKFFTFMSRVADILLLSIVALICCIPIVTIGASLTALYYVTLKMVRNEESYIFRSFFKSFKQNFKQATIINLIMLAVGLILYLDFSIVRSVDGSVSTVMQIIFAVFALLYAMVLLYVYPVLSKFYNSIRNTFRNALLMSIRHLPYTFLMLLIACCPLLILFVQSYQVQATLIMLLFLMGLGTIAFCQSFFFVKIFDNYIPQETEDADTPEGTAPEAVSSNTDTAIPENTDENSGAQS